MNEIKRYDQALAEHLEHLTMPDEDLAWANMKQMLDEGDDDPVVVPFFRRFGCLLLGLVAALILSIGGWLYYQNNSSPVSASEHSATPGNKTGDSKTGDSKTGGNKTGDTKTGLPDNNNQAITVDSATGTGSNVVPVSGPTGSTDSSATGSTTGTTGNKFSGNKNSFVSGRSNIKVSGAATNDGGNAGEEKNRRKNSGIAKGKTKVRIMPTVPSGGDEETGNQPGNTTGTVKQDRDTARMRTNVQNGGLANDSSGNSNLQKNKDSNSVAKKDTVVKKQTTPAPAAKEEKKQKDKYWMVAAGLTVYQPLPLNGQSAVPYNQYGRKGSLTDYIPSAYLRLYRSKKWFIHTEFRYGAPQNVKPFIYKQEIRDSAQMVWRTTYQLNKTYYHQIPFSFNYYVLPNLSVGAGVIYNRFTGAITDRDIYRRIATSDTLVASAIIIDRDNTRFVKNHFQWSAETQYQWKRFFIGVKYSKDINPYIKFNDITTGAPVEKKAEAFNIFLRYELWRSKKL